MNTLDISNPILLTASERIEIENYRKFNEYLKWLKEENKKDAMEYAERARKEREIKERAILSDNIEIAHIKQLLQEKRVSLWKQTFWKQMEKEKVLSFYKKYYIPLKDILTILPIVNEYHGRTDVTEILFQTTNIFDSIQDAILKFEYCGNGKFVEDSTNYIFYDDFFYKMLNFDSFWATTAKGKVIDKDYILYNDFVALCNLLKDYPLYIPIQKLLDYNREYEQMYQEFRPFLRQGIEKIGAISDQKEDEVLKSISSKFNVYSSKHYFQYENDGIKRNRRLYVDYNSLIWY